MVPFGTRKKGLDLLHLCNAGRLLSRTLRESEICCWSKNSTSSSCRGSHVLSMKEEVERNLAYPRSFTHRKRIPWRRQRSESIPLCRYLPSPTPHTDVKDTTCKLGCTANSHQVPNKASRRYRSRQAVLFSELTGWKGR